MVNKNTPPNEIVDDPGLTQDSYALLRQAANYGKMKQGTAPPPPQVAANNNQIADNKAEMQNLKYSIHGIPEGIDHAAEEKRLADLIQKQTASANDIDNYITLSVARQNAALASEGLSADAKSTAPVAHPPEAAASESAGGTGARQPRRSSQRGYQSGGSSAPPVSSARRASAMGPRGVEVSSGGESSAPVQKAPPSSAVQRAGEANGVKGNSGKAMDSKPAASASVSGITTGPTRSQEILGRDRMAALSKQELRNPDGSAKDPKRAQAEHVVRERELRKLSPEDQALMREYSGAKDPEAARTAAAWEDSGANEVNLPKVVRTGGGFAANEMLMGSAMKGARNMGQAASEGLPNLGRRVGAAAETAKAVASRQASPPVVNNNISKATKPPGLQMLDNMDQNIPTSGFSKAQSNVRPGHTPQRSGAAQSARMTADMADQQAAQAAQARAARKPQPMGPTKLAHKASEYLEARDSGLLHQPKINVDMRPKGATQGPQFNAMRDQSAPPRPKPQLPEGYSVNTQTPAAVKRNSQTRAQRAAGANKAAAAERETEKAAASKKAPAKKATDTKATKKPKK